MQELSYRCLSERDVVLIMICQWNDETAARDSSSEGARTLHATCHEEQMIAHFSTLHA